MAYSKTTWVDRQVQKPMTFTIQVNGDGTNTLIPAEGTIITAGTPITAAKLNNIENGLETVSNQLDLMDDLLIPWISAPVLNGWGVGVSYCKTKTGIVTVKVYAYSGGASVSWGAAIASLPEGIVPEIVYVPFKVIELESGNILDMFINPGGHIDIAGGFSQSKSYSGMVSYYV